MTTIKKSGFFPEYYLNIKNVCSDLEMDNFGKLTSDLDRVRFMFDLKILQDNAVTIEREFCGKSQQIAADLKEKGNQAFKNKKWLDALMIYNKSYLAMPHDNPEDIAIILANRSAALFYLEKFDEALLDITRSIEKGYPEVNGYKLYERQAKCFLAKKNLPKAFESFKRTIQALDNCKLPIDKRSKIERDAMIMIKMLEKDPQIKKASSTKLSSKKHAQYYNKAIAFDYSDEEGRFAKAIKDIEVGEELLIEQPNVSVLLEKYSKTHCHTCFLRTTTPLSCPRCPDVVYCSELCFQTAMKTCHKYECGILPIIWRSGISINCHMALRIISSKSVNYFQSIKDNFSIDMSLDELEKLPTDDYRRVYNLLRHEDKRSPSSYFQYTLMAHFLTSCLKETNYFGSSSDVEVVNMIGSLVLRNLQFLQFNSHEIFELHKRESGEAQKTVFIGAGVYPTLAMFNHSCDPGITKYFQGNTIHAHAVKPITAGSAIAENYGPLYTQDAKSDRQQKLKDLYNFDCNCEACLKDWPRFDEMDNSVVPLRCDGDPKCDNIIQISSNCNEFMITCVTCGHVNNILKGLKIMQDTEMITKTAKRLYNAGDIKKALDKYLDLLKIMHEVLAPPFSDFCQCQQNIKDCFLHFGNVYLLS